MLIMAASDALGDAGDGTGYLPRVVDASVERLLRLIPTVVIEGPRGCGKTTTARQFAASEVSLDAVPNARRTALTDPRAVLDGDTPRLIDEWQLAPGIWNAVRRASDDRRNTGQFILTGSANPDDDVTRHSGAGRVARIRMRPLSLFELGHSNGAVSLRSLIEGVTPAAQADAHTLGDMATWTCAGGYPQTIGLPVDDAQEFLRLYLDEVTRIDISRTDGIERDPVRVSRLIASLARNVSSRASLRTLALDTNGGRLDTKTVTSYLQALERVFVAEDVPAWSPRLRSRVALRSAPVRQFADPALACATLHADPGRLLDDLETFGLLFESLVLRDLRIYAGPLDARVGHYRDETDLEVDAVIELRDGAWAAFEVKLGGEAAIEHAAASLAKLAARVDPKVGSRQRALAVLTATGGYAYTRPDGISVIPITTLGP